MCKAMSVEDARVVKGDPSRVAQDQGVSGREISGRSREIPDSSQFKTVLLVTRDAGRTLKMTKPVRPLSGGDDLDEQPQARSEVRPNPSEESGSRKRPRTSNVEPASQSADWESSDLSPIDAAEMAFLRRKQKLINLGITEEEIEQELSSIVLFLRYTLQTAKFVTRNEAKRAGVRSRLKSTLNGLWVGWLSGTVSKQRLVDETVFKFSQCSAEAEATDVLSLFTEWHFKNCQLRAYEQAGKSQPKDDVQNNPYNNTPTTTNFRID
ncbi:hypothetical protein NDN08_001371 [Rhodosorus marinus]|uniref:Uncharacterized protein n=1 Tax=Rhodosorus marinus TaxID=101924 RepID=A0AAV8UUR6_9RHOD|nr:hypothetical protein NDN08_001371 [Rhodosorus marinus]